MIDATTAGRRDESESESMLGGHVAKDQCIVEVEESEPAFRFSLRRLLKFMGPGLLMSIAFVDPGNLESALQAGVTTGYDLLWVMLVTMTLGFIVQMQAAKLGVVTGRHLAEHCRQQYKPTPRYALWIMAEVAIIGSDIQEVIGSAIAILLLSGGRIPLWAGVLITACDSFLLLFIEKIGVQFLELFFGLLIGTMVASFGIMFFIAGVPMDEVLRGFFVPTLPQRDVPTAVAIFGALIMPHNIYLHSALVQSRKLLTKTSSTKKEAMVYFSIESALSLLSAVFINLFVIAVFAAGFSGGEETPDIGLENAGLYLGRTFGTAMVVIWALGLLAAGQSSTMTGTYTGQFVMGGYLNLKISPMARVIVTRAVAIVPTMLVTLTVNSSGTELDTLNQSLNLLQSIQLPFALVPLITFTSSRAVMGDFVNSWQLTAVMWSITAFVVGINASAAYQVISVNLAGQTLITWAVGIVCILYVVFIIFLVLSPTEYIPDHEAEDSIDFTAPLLADEDEPEVPTHEAATANRGEKSPRGGVHIYATEEGEELVQGQAEDKK